MASKKNKKTDESLVQGSNCCEEPNKLILWGLVALVVGFVIGYVIGVFVMPTEPTGVGNQTTVETVEFEPDLEKIDKVKTLMEKLYLATYGTEGTGEVSSVEKDEIVKIIMVVEGEEIDVYTDMEYGKLLWITEVPIDDYEQEIDNYLSELDLVTDSAPPTGEDVDAADKTEKPKVELFIMSYCPYGLQVQKGILPVAELLGDKIDFEVKFVHYIMHKEKEATENTRQYCIQQEEKEKYLDYLTCFLENDDYAGCIVEAEIDAETIDSCMAQADEEFGITTNLENSSLWYGSFPRYPVHEEETLAYGVQGSPTLVINGKIVNTDRSPQDILNKICSRFLEEPEECNEALSTVPSSYGFGFGESSGGNSAGVCG